MGYVTQELGEFTWCPVTMLEVSGEQRKNYSVIRSGRALPEPVLRQGSLRSHILNPRDSGKIECQHPSASRYANSHLKGS